MTYTSSSKMSPQFWVTKYFRKTYIMNNQYKILICNKKNLSIKPKYPSVSHVSPNVEDGSPIAQVAFVWKSSLKNTYTWWNEYNFSPELHKFRPIFVALQIATTYAQSLKYHFVLTLMLRCFCKFQGFSLTNVNYFFSVLKIQQYPFKPQFGICDLVIIIAWIITRAKKFDALNSGRSRKYHYIR